MAHIEIADQAVDADRRAEFRYAGDQQGLPIRSRAWRGRSVLLLTAFGMLLAGLVIVSIGTFVGHHRQLAIHK